MAAILPMEMSYFIQARKCIRKEAGKEKKSKHQEKKLRQGTLLLTITDYGQMQFYRTL